MRMNEEKYHVSLMQFKEIDTSCPVKILINSLPGDLSIYLLVVKDTLL